MAVILACVDCTEFPTPPVFAPDAVIDAVEPACALGTLDPADPCLRCGPGAEPVSWAFACGDTTCARAVQLALGKAHGCARLDDGSVWCWGDQEYGQCGQGRSLQPTEPVPIPGLGVVTDVVAGLFHTCVLTVEGEVLCWGRGESGQVGVPPLADETVATPTPVPVSDVVELAASLSDTTCARTKLGEVWCWGRRIDGADPAEFGVDPERVPELGTTWQPDKVYLGSHVACASVGDRASLVCWGDNRTGQLGNGTLQDSAVPTPVDGVEGPVLAVGLGVEHVCALSAGGKSLACWGANNLGMLGVPTLLTTPTDGLMLEPQEIGDVWFQGRSFADLAVGWRHGCVVLGDDGSVWCWGRNDEGQLGTSDVAFHWEPHPIAVGAAAAVGASWQHSCVIAQSGSVRCWGINDRGQLDGRAGTYRNEVPVCALAPP